MTPSRVSGVYAITPEIDDTAELVGKVSAALAGGVRMVQYRNKNGSAALRRAQCIALRECTLDFNCQFILNDDSRLAFDVDADGVHLGRDDESLADARRRLGAGKIIGVSCYNDLERARALQTAGADYVAFGSFFTSRTKPAAVCASIGLLSRAKSKLKVPIVAIGGINEVNAAALIEAGADAIAVLSALFIADNVASRARTLSRLFLKRALPLQH